MRIRVAGALAVVVGALAPATASADKVIEAGTPDRYTTPTVSMDQGERLTFRNNDFKNHDVVSMKVGPKDEPLFRSELIGQGAESFVEGSQYLTAGSYDFFCSIHASMKGTLTVTSAGTPATRPGTGGSGGQPQPGTDTTAPALTMRVTVGKRSSVTLRYGLSEAATVRFAARASGKLIGTKSVTRDGAGKATVTLRFKGRLPRRGTKITITAVATDAAGNKATKKATARA